MKYLLCICCMICLNQLNAQVLDTAKLVVFYRMQFVPDSATHEVYPVRNPYVLLIGKNTALFEHLFTYETDSAKVNTNVTGHGWVRGLLGAYFQPEIYTNPGTRIQIVNESLIGKNYLTSNTMPDFHWQLKEGRKQIGNYTCYKALGYWRGRYWEAWFCPELPYNYGPWKLNGLPGLILEANDTQQEYFFSAIHFKFTIEYSHPLKLPERYQEINERDFNKILRAFHTDPAGFSKANPLNADQIIKIDASSIKRDPNYTPPKGEIHKNNNNPEKHID